MTEFYGFYVFDNLQHFPDLFVFVDFSDISITWFIQCTDYFLLSFSGSTANNEKEYDEEILPFFH